MGVVKVRGVIPLLEGETATFQLCDRYGNVFTGHDVQTQVREGGYFSVKLVDTCEDRAYKVHTNAGAIMFEVHKRDDGNPYLVNLFSTSLSHKKFISFDDPFDTNILLNIIDCINRYNNGEEILSLDEREIICAIQDENNQDKVVALIKKNLGSNTQIIDKVLVPISGQPQEPMTLYLDDGNTAQGKIDFPFINTGTLIFKNSAYDLSSYVSITSNTEAGTMQGIYSIPATLVNSSLNGIYELGFNNGGVIETSEIRIEVC